MSWPGSQISFSQVREDPQTEFAVVARVYKAQKRPLRILMIGSGGCTALSLLALPEIEHIDVVDANPAQLQLISLRLAALKNLSLEQQKILLGLSGTTQQREEVFAILELFLTEEQQRYWQQHLPEIMFGVNRVGKFEELFRMLQNLLRENIGFCPLEHPEKAIAHEQWQRCFDVVFEREYLAQVFGRAAVDYSMSQQFSDHFSQVFAKALLHYKNRKNYFLRQVLEDHYGSEEDIPPYLQPHNQNAIRHLGERITLHHGYFLDILEKLRHQQTWDIIQTSNISDWMPIPEMQRMFSIVKQALTPDGALLARRLNGDHYLEQVINDILTVDASWNSQLKEQDRSFFYNEIVVGWNNYSMSHS